MLSWISADSVFGVAKQLQNAKIWWQSGAFTEPSEVLNNNFVSYVW